MNGFSELQTRGLHAIFKEFDADRLLTIHCRVLPYPT